MPNLLRTSVRRHPSWDQIEGQVTAARSVVELIGRDSVRFAGGAAEVDELSAAGIRMVRHELSEHLPFGDGEFEFAICSHAFHHLDDPEAACREMARIARAGIVIAPAAHSEPGLGGATNRWIIMDGGDELLLMERSTWDGGASAEPKAASGDERTPELSLPAPMNSPAFDVVFPWTGTLRCRTLPALPGSGISWP